MAIAKDGSLLSLASKHGKENHNGKGNILLIDDDSGIRAVMSMSLVREGYQVDQDGLFHFENGTVPNYISHQPF